MAELRSCSASRTALLRTLAMASFGALLACHDDRASAHVHASAPPAPATLPASAGGAVYRTELPLGELGPGAKIVSIANATTGAPAPLTGLRDSLDVLALVAFGP